jgi:hypothetical protein
VNDIVYEALGLALFYMLVLYGAIQAAIVVFQLWCYRLPKTPPAHCAYMLPDGACLLGSTRCAHTELCGCSHPWPSLAPPPDKFVCECGTLVFRDWDAYVRHG